MGSRNAAGRAPRIVFAMLLVTLGTSGCAGMFALGPQRVTPLRISDEVEEGDSRRRASLRLVLDGLSADERGDLDRALGQYERAIQIDSTNPYAYLALARHHVDGTRPERALPFLDQARSLFDAQGGTAPEVEVHLIGLAGASRYAAGAIREGAPLLEEARARAPGVWDDGHLSAGELR